MTGTEVAPAQAVPRHAEDGRLRAVLVGGCPRSGTTLLAAMLGHGPDVLTVPESDFKLRVLASPRTDTSGLVDRERATGVLADDWRFRLWAIPARGPVQADGPPRVAYGEWLADLVRRHGATVGKPRPTTWVDHTPSNIKYARTLGRLLPEATFVHVVRDGRGVAASVLALDWGPNTIAEAARWWAAHVAMGQAATAVLGADRVVTVRYEDLLRDGATTLRRVCAAVDLPFSSAMLSSRDYVVQHYTRAQHDLVAAPPDATRADLWQRRLPARAIEEFEHLTGDLLDCLGYELHYGVTARRRDRADRVAEAIHASIRHHVVDRCRRRVRRRRAATSDPRSSR